MSHELNKQSSDTEPQNERWRKPSHRLRKWLGRAGLVGVTAASSVATAIVMNHHSTPDRAPVIAEAPTSPQAALDAELKQAYPEPVYIRKAGYNGKTIMDGGIKRGIVDVQLRGTEKNPDIVGDASLPDFHYGGHPVATLSLDQTDIHHYQTLDWTSGQAGGFLQLNPRMGYFHGSKEREVDYDIMVGAEGVAGGDTRQVVVKAGTVAVFGSHDKIDRIDARPPAEKDRIKVGSLQPGDYEFTDQ